MSDNPKKATEMTPREYEAARTALIHQSRFPRGMTAAEAADLAQRRAETPKLATEMSETEYRAAKARAIRNSYR